MICYVLPCSRPHRFVSETVVSLAQQLDVLDILRNFGWQRPLRVGLGEAVEAERLRVNFPLEIGVAAFPATPVLDDQRFGSNAQCEVGDWVVD